MVQGKQGLGVQVKLEKTMFREYDIRGRVEEKELNEASVKAIGQAFGSMLKRKNVAGCVVGFDARSYSEGLKNYLAEGIASTGVNVVDIGMVTTPMAYFAQYYLNVKGVAMLTASHNPNGWSGFKLGYGLSSTLLPADVKKLYRLVEEESFESGKGEISQKNVLEAYIHDLTKRVELKRKLKVVVNARNGTAAVVVPALLKAAGVEVVEQFCEMDFNFPNGNPNPSDEKMLEELGKKVIEEKADLGFAFDGDGDRLGMVDERGQKIYPDKILILLSKLLLNKKPGAKIVFDVKCTQALPEEIERNGGIPVMWKTGHSYIKEKAREVGAALAGERSGHIFIFENYYGFDDAALAALDVLELLASQEKPLSEVMASLPQYVSSPVFKAPCPDEAKYEVVEKLVERFKHKFDKVIDINGARVVFDGSWFLVRASSNLPELVLVFEAKTEERLEELQGIVKKELAEFPQVSTVWESG